MRFPQEIDGQPSREAEDADAAAHYAAMIESIYVDREDLDAEQCPPDRRFFLADKEAWIYEHGNICELVYVRSTNTEEW